jgi:hypothetical protein
MCVLYWGFLPVFNLLNIMKRNSPIFLRKKPRVGSMLRMNATTNLTVALLLEQQRRGGDKAQFKLNG